MKLSIALSPLKTSFGPLFFTGALEEGLAQAASIGFDGVELSLRNPDTVDFPAIVRSAESRNLEIFAIATGQSFVNDNLSLASGNPDLRKGAVSRLCRHVDFAAQVGARVILGGIIGSLNSDIPVSREIAYAAITEVVEYASAKGVTILLEPINRYETNVFITQGQAARFVRESGMDNVRILSDVFHMNIEEASIEESLKANVDVIGYVHAADSNRLAPGMGHLDFPSIIATLKEIGYDGVVGFEYLPVPDSLAAAKSGFDYITGIL